MERVLRVQIAANDQETRLRVTQALPAQAATPTPTPAPTICGWRHDCRMGFCGGLVPVRGGFQAGCLEEFVRSWPAVPGWRIRQ